MYRIQLVLLLFSLTVLVGCDSDTIEETREITDYNPPKDAGLAGLIDDKLSDKKTSFDPNLVHREPVGDWLINLSKAVTKLDVPIIKPDSETGFLALHPSYRAAFDQYNSEFDAKIIPSVNMVDGKAKQFDDGLYAAIDLAYFQGYEGVFVSHVSLVKQILEKAGPSSPAAPFLAAGLSFVRVDVKVDDESAKEQWIEQFLARPTASKPIGFYTWNDQLKQCFQFLRFFQQPFDEGQLETPLAISEVLAGDETLNMDYNRVNDFFSRLTNPLKDLTIAQLIGETEVDLLALQKKHGTERARVAMFPASSSREGRLFERVFATKPLSPNANLMQELIGRIRSGEIDLAPADNAGWYDHQVYALETLLLPERGEENNKLLLTKQYKKRMLEAFRALITKRKETHIRQLGDVATTSEAPPRELEKVKPRLRIEPCPSFYIRTARSYAFLLDMLTAAIGEEALSSINGLTKDGYRFQDLHAELEYMRDLFYGLYLVSAEDIGMQPSFADGEPVDQTECYETATMWLEIAFEDPDLEIDTRVSVPLLYSRERDKTRLWATLGIRVTKLDAEFVVAPSIKPKEGDGEWEEVPSKKLETAHYLIPVDEFAEFEIPGNNTLTRRELRKICNQHGSKDAILAALQSDE